MEHLRPFSTCKEGKWYPMILSARTGSHVLSILLVFFKNMFKAYNGVIVPQLFGFLSIILLILGLLFVGINIIFTNKNSSFMIDIVTGLIASVFLGLGSFFLLQWCGIYV